MTVRSIATPAVFGSTRNRLSPFSVRAATIRASATWPSSTKPLAPFSLNPLPDRSATVAIRDGACFGPSSTASETIASPAAIRGSQAACCSAEPPLSTVADSTPDPRKGEGVSVRPSASAITPASTAPRPEPPCSSGMMTPANPISPKARHRSRETPSASLESRSLRRCAIGACSLRKPSAASFSIVCSSVRIRGMGSGSRQLKQVFGDDVQLNLAGPALDGIGLGPQPVARRLAAARPLAFPLQRV